MKVTITLSETMIADAKKVMGHKRGEATMETVISDAIKQGLYQFLYRYDRNVTKWQEQKENKQLLAQLLREKAEREQSSK